MFGVLGFTGFDGIFRDFGCSGIGVLIRRNTAALVEVGSCLA